MKAKAQAEWYMVPVLLNAHKATKGVPVQIKYVPVTEIQGTRSQAEVRVAGERVPVVVFGKVYLSSDRSPGMAREDANNFPSAIRVPSSDLLLAQLEEDKYIDEHSVFKVNARISFNIALVMYYLGYTSRAEYEAACSYMNAVSRAELQELAVKRATDTLLQMMAGERGLTPNQVRKIVRDFERDQKAEVQRRLASNDAPLVQAPDLPPLDV